MNNSLIVDLNTRIGAILAADRTDRSRLLFDEYRTSNYENRDAYILTLIARLMFEHDRRRLGPVLETKDKP